MAATLLAVTPLVLILLTVGWVAAVASWSEGLRRLFGQRRATWRDALAGLYYGIAGAVVITFVVGGGLQLLLRYLGVEIPPVQEQLRDLATGPAAPIAAIAIVGLAPIGEELLFRGMLFQSLQKPLRFWPAAIVSGVIFGIIHLEPLVAVVTAILGVYLAWIFQRRGTLLVPIIAHSIFNLLGLVLIRLGLG
ncbi:MAG: lysostaphin resistance A-like protein [Egibacteraceae bacterium]